VIAGSVFVNQFGVSRSTEITRFALDRWHVWGPNASLFWRAVRLRLSSPARDARAALSRNDRRFCGMAGIGLFFPGVPDGDMDRLNAQFGHRLLATGCVITSEDDERYRQAAYEYAAAYNRTILAAVRP